MIMYNISLEDINKESLTLVYDFVSNFYLGTFGKDVGGFLNEDSEIEKDLKINGDDADFFMTDFVEKFSVDHSDFNGREYFGYEHEAFDPIFPFLRFFLGNRKWLPLARKDRKVLKIKDLALAIETGKL